MWESTLTRLDVLVALVTLAGAGKSAYNGHIRRLVRSIYLLPEVKEKVEEMEQRQEEMIDGLVAVSVAESDDETSVDTDALARSLRGNSYRMYLKRDGQRSNPYAESEDEEVWVRPDVGLDDEVDEPE